MKFEKLNTTLTLTANIGVLIGLFLVAYELRQNDDSLNASIQLSLSNSYEELATFGVANPSLRDAMIKVYTQPEEIGNATRFAIMSWQYRYQLVLFTTYNLYLDDIVTETFWREKASHYTINLLLSDTLRKIHEDGLHDEMFSPEFIAALESVYAEQLANRQGTTQ